MLSKSKQSLWVIGLIALGLAASPVEAQDEVQASSGDAKKLVVKRPGLVEEVVVTARKREESIQDIPLSVTPFTADGMEKRGFVGLDDIAAATPGFTYEGFITGGNHGNAVIRGLAQQFTTSRIQNVSFFIDGVYLQRQSMLNLGMIDMERVEVIKGPQNALFGRNAFAGAVNYITAKPKAEYEHYISATVGDNDRQDMKVSFNGPIGLNDRLLAKFTAGISEFDGSWKNEHPMADVDTPGESTTGNLGGWDDEVYSFMLSYDPTDWLMLRASYYKNEVVKETGAGYSISGVNAARFGFRFDDQLDLNCNWRTVPDIGSPFVEHSGFSAWCGELPKSADKANGPRTAKGIIVDPRGIGQVASTDVVTFMADAELSESWTMHYLFGLADHESFSTGGPGGEDPLVGRGIAVDTALYLLDNTNPDAYKFVNTFSGRPNTELEAFSHELRFDFDRGGDLRASIGGYYSVTKDREYSTVYLSDVCSNDTAEHMQNCYENLDTPSSATPDPGELMIGSAYDQVVRQHAKARLEDTSFEDEVTAIFGSLTYTFFDGLDLTIEGRFTEERKSVVRHTDSFGLKEGEEITYNLPNDPVFPFIANSVSSAIIVPRDEEVFRYVTPRAILNWAIDNDHMVYASAAKGLKTGGFNNALAESDLVFDEATNWTYEIGTKNTFFDGAMKLNAAIFVVDWTGLQGSVPPEDASLSTSDVVRNIGDAYSEGIEIETSYAFESGFSIDAGLTYNDAEYNDGVIYGPGLVTATSGTACNGETCSADGDVGGNQLARSSREQYSFGINYFTTFESGWAMSTRLDANYQSKQYLTPLNLGWVPDRLITNGSVNLSDPDERWQLTFWGKNLTDEEYPASAFVIGVFNQYMVGMGARRSFGATAKYTFF